MRAKISRGSVAEAAGTGSGNASANRGGWGDDVTNSAPRRGANAPAEYTDGSAATGLGVLFCVGAEGVRASVDATRSAGCAASPLAAPPARPATSGDAPIVAKTAATDVAGGSAVAEWASGPRITHGDAATAGIA
jgi:hypothetical protein